MLHPILKLNGTDPLLYAAQKAIGPRQLNDEEARETARRAYQHNSKLSSELISKAIGRSRQTVDTYVADLKGIFSEGYESKNIPNGQLRHPSTKDFRSFEYSSK